MTIEDFKLICENRTDEELAICVIEEMSELTKVLTKYMRKDEKFKTDELIEESSHCFIMLNLLLYKLDIPYLDVFYEQENLIKKILKTIK